MALFRPPFRRRADDERWNTLPVDGEVLAVARTLTSATRVLDALLVLPSRVSLYFTVNPGSAFTAGLDAYAQALEREGVTVLPWPDAVARSFDVAVACAVHRSMSRLRAPLVIMPHGAGYNRLVRQSTGDGSSAAGLSRRELTHRGKVFPAVVGLSHPGQFEQLRRSCPEAVTRAQVVGDPCFDRIRDSLPQRDRYRAALGALDGRKLVVVNSTWSGHSLLGQHPDLPLRLVQELPADEFAVALVLHPNIWARHDPHKLMRSAEAAGLMVIPPQRGWQAALVAADWVVGDHGSVSFYGAALDRVTLLAATGEAELDPHSPTYAFGRTAPPLDPGRDLHAQLLLAAEQYDGAALRAVTDLSLGEPGQATRNLLRILGPFVGAVSTPKDQDSPVPYPDPRPVTGRPTAYDVTGERDGRAVRIRRYPLSTEPVAARGFYTVTSEEPRLGLRAVAEVVVREHPHGELPPAAWLALTADQLPGLNLAVTALDRDCALVRLRSGLLLEATAVRPWGSPETALDPTLLGAALGVWLTRGGSGAELTEQELTVHTGDRVAVRVRFSARPGDRDCRPIS
ncbi:hypothetical protein [Streptacidiphilus cavernicola]|uniref:Translation initiation factor IF-2 n=1 Tax=Streptacidiphilus cavernicola TaxID=3342716 RepID=A0ABV6VX50_9ACTN